MSSKPSPVSLVVFSCLVFCAGGVARAQRLVSAYDPRKAVKPPTMRGLDGQSGTLQVDADFLARAASYRRSHPGVVRADGAVVQMGDVAIVEGSADVLDTDGPGIGVKLDGIAKKVIAKFGDHFEAMTLWLTFDDKASPAAEAYEFTVHNEVSGLGMNLSDLSASYGSGGTLRSILNMKRVWRYLKPDSPEAMWTPYLRIWGQESGHRWMVFMDVIDRRSGQSSQALLGRDCAHYNRFVDTQASVHDGLAWTDNGNGTFTASDETMVRYGNLDLYGMGLLPPDEMPPFFFIDNIPGYTYPTCAAYADTARPLQPTISGTRVDVSIDDIVGANGPRLPSADDSLKGMPQDYFREIEVVVTGPTEVATDTLPVRIAQLVDQGRQYWEHWVRGATGNRLVICTQIGQDCGDPRSDVTDVRFNTAGKAPSAGPLTMEVDVTNGGTRPSTGVSATLTTTLPGAAPQVQTQPVGMLAPGAKQTVSFPLDLKTTACGTELAVKAAAVSDYHRNRQVKSLVVGAEGVLADGFEIDSGWTVNPDGTDTTKGAIWERATPQRTEITLGNVVQPDGAHTGIDAWVTGASATAGARDTFVHTGYTTLESPELDATAWREPRLRYWVTFAGMQESTVSAAVVPSPNGRLSVQARAIPVAGDGGVMTAADGGAIDGGVDGWVEIDHLENEIAPNWAQRTAPIPPALLGGHLKLRFVADDANPSAGGVEAAIDDVEITSNLAACYAPVSKPSSGGCTLAGVDTGSGAGPTVLVAAGLVVAIRRRRRRPARRPR